MAFVQMGFFAEAGPVQVFVSNHLIPDEFSFVAADEPSFVSADEAVRIVAGAEARLRIVGTRVDATEIVRAHPPVPHTESIVHGNLYAYTFDLAVSNNLRKR